MTTHKLSTPKKKKLTKKGNLIQNRDLFIEFSDLNKNVAKFSDLIKKVTKFSDLGKKVTSPQFSGHLSFIMVTKFSKGRLPNKKPIYIWNLSKPGGGGGLKFCI